MRTLGWVVCSMNAVAALALLLQGNGVLAAPNVFFAIACGFAAMASRRD